MRTFTLPITLAAALALPATAAAAPTATTPAPAAAAAKRPVARAAAPRVVVKTRFVNPLRARGGALALEHRAFLVRGYVSRWAPNQKVRVTLYRSGKRFAERRVSLHRGPRSSGRFFVWVRPHGTGRIGIQALHRPTAVLGAGRAKGLYVTAFSPISAARPVVTLVQHRLAAEGYAVGQTGYLDARTRRALLAFRKVNGMARTYSMSGAITSKLIAGTGAFKVRYRRDGRHVEGDLTHQVIALIDAGGKVHAVYPISSGKPSTPTVLGRFHVYRRSPGTNSEGMVYSSYFIRGYAVHGYASVPTYAASHGCLRVPVPDAIPIYDWIRYGTPVDVYYR